MHSQLYEGFDKTLQNDDDAEGKLVVAATRRSAKKQRVSAQRRSSRHQVGGCEDRACNYFEKEGTRVSWLNTILLAGIQVVYTREYLVYMYEVVYSVYVSSCSDIKSI